MSPIAQVDGDTIGDIPVTEWSRLTGGALAAAVGDTGTAATFTDGGGNHSLVTHPTISRR